MPDRARLQLQPVGCIADVDTTLSAPGGCIAVCNTKPEKKPLRPEHQEVLDRIADPLARAVYELHIRNNTRPPGGMKT